jgi:hypothetical protein
MATNAVQIAHAALSSRTADPRLNQTLESLRSTLNKAIDTINMLSAIPPLVYDNNPDHYLNGQGAWATPPGGGSYDSGYKAWVVTG